MTEKPGQQADDDRRGPSIEIPADVDFMDAGELRYEDGEDLELDVIADRAADDA